MILVSTLAMAMLLIILIDFIYFAVVIIKDKNNQRKGK